MQKIKIAFGADGCYRHMPHGSSDDLVYDNSEPDPLWELPDLYRQLDRSVTRLERILARKAVSI